MNNKQTFGIIGGGMLGMTLAFRLTQEGYKVTLFDAAPSFGGLASAWNTDGMTWDKFYHVILLSDSYTRNLLKDLDLDKDMKWVETKTGFYTNGKLYSMSNTFEFLKFPPLNIIDKLRLGGTIFYTSKMKNWKKLEKITVEKFLRRLSGKKTFEKIWLPLLRAKLGDTYKKTSAAFIWATIQRMYSARKSGLKKEMFGYLPGGYARILEVFSSKLKESGVVLNSGFRAKTIYRSENNVNIEFSDGSKFKFDNVINTVPSSFIPEMIPDLSPEEIQKHSGIEYLGVICPNLILKKAISPYYVTNITDPGVPFTGVIEMTALVNKSELKNKHLVYLPKYVQSNDPYFNKSDKEISDQFIDYLLKMYPHLHLNDIEHIEIARARNVFALNQLNYSSNLPPVKSSVNGLYLLNSAHITNGTLNVNETIQLAQEQLKEILDDVLQEYQEV
ncbi:NAD(P)/FAD-dependent oxidoreductase [Saccharicrinis sp. FJH54]|uniref:NAD(P)/FAD-dependent oxidoreductase n=1 Tax=Saccharicrinis sp. FJH54 TaxID=3344665 RepID=UPI0035D47E25